jgi:HAD superfamily hydrolase (TIGR01509 family)
MAHGGCGRRRLAGIIGAVPISAVLFDMDGTLVDSEPLWSISMDQLAAECGGVLSDPAREAMVGTDMPTTMRIFYHDLGLVGRDPILDGLRLAELTVAVFEAGLPWRPGARELLGEVRATGLPIALVTSTERRMVDIALKTLGKFDVVVCGDEVDFTKPHPWPYLRAAYLLGVPIAECLAIEDSPGGVRSAVAAGAQVLAVPCDVPLGDDLGALVVPTLSGIDLFALRSLF